MAGHSKWSQVKHIKGPLDVKRGAAFSKLVKAITVAARLRGGDLSGDPRPLPAVETARAANMPKDNTERAIKNDVTTPPGRLHTVAGGFAADVQKHTCLPGHLVMMTDRQIAARVLHPDRAPADDTQNVYSNFEIPEETLAHLPA